MAVRIGLIRSVLAVLAAIVLSFWLVSALGEWGENKFLGGVFVAAVYSGFALGFIWLGVFVAHVIGKARRVFDEASRHTGTGIAKSRNAEEESPLRWRLV